MRTNPDNRYEKHHKTVSVHILPAFRDVKVGDTTTIGECRPLSKNVRFNMLKITKAQGAYAENNFKKF